MPERINWGVVLASCSGLIVSNGPVNVYAFSVFLKPVSALLGVSRGVFSSAIGLALLVTAAASPVFGKLVDRFGFRRCLLLSIPLYALGLAGLSLLPSSKFGIYFLFAFTGFLCVGQTPTAYSKAISVWSDQKRGLSLGIAMSGVGVGTILMPQYAIFLIHHFGWRRAYLGLGSSVLVLAFVPVFFWLKEQPPEVANQKLKHKDAPDGLTLTQSLRSRKF